MRKARRTATSHAVTRHVHASRAHCRTLVSLSLSLTLSLSCVVFEVCFNVLVLLGFVFMQHICQLFSIKVSFFFLFFFLFVCVCVWITINLCTDAKFNGFYWGQRCTDLFALFFFVVVVVVVIVVVVDKLCTDAITLIDFTGGWGQRWVSAQALTCFFFVFLFYLIIFLHFDRIYCDLCKYYSVCVCICEYLFYIYWRF
jgi:hypothetical protein